MAVEKSDVTFVGKNFLGIECLLGFGPAAEALLFRQKGPKLLSPGVDL